MLHDAIEEPFCLNGSTMVPQSFPDGALLKIKVLHDTLEEPFCLKGSKKDLKHLKNLSVSQKLLCDERRFFRL